MAAIDRDLGFGIWDLGFEIGSRDSGLGIEDLGFWERVLLIIVIRVNL